MNILKAGSVIGILGGGQLAKMMSVAASQMGFKVHIYAPEADSIAAEVSARFTIGQFDDIDALMTFADDCNVITYEFENIAVAALKKLEKKHIMRPNSKALEISQSRLSEKKFAEKCGAVTARYAPIKQREDIDAAIAKMASTSILKSDRLGYDGKGQARIDESTNLSGAWMSVGQRDAILEEFVDFEAEFSVILARTFEGNIIFWDSSKNTHADGILRQSSLPAGPLIKSQRSEARKLAKRIAEDLDYIGVLTIEFFATADGPVFNEMAPRVHNSGHWTIEAATTSQFENHIRAITGMPLGATDTISDRIVMENLIGEYEHKLDAILKDDRNHLHLYGKANIAEGRKMGHVTRLYFD